MNKVPGHLTGSRALDIGAEPDFVLGDLSVFPSLREVGVDGRRETVEPRVMQVLVALVRAGGAVVSRDRLIESCWGGRLVGDDAINSCVAKVRALAALTSPAAFEIETVPRVGYRLRARGVVAPAEVKPTPIPAPLGATMSRGERRWHWIAIAGVAVAAIAALAAWWSLKPRGSLDWVVVDSQQPFIGTSLIERYPAISPDGTILAYSAGPNLTTRQIYLRIIKGDSSLQLTHETFDATSPAWSPDGTTLAYSVFQSGHPCRIMEIAIPSGTPHLVGQCRTAERTELVFDPPGRALIFADSDVVGLPTRLVRLDVDTGKRTALTNPPRTTLGDYEPVFSPDSSYLVYLRDLGGNRGEIRVRRLSDGVEHVADRMNGCDLSAAWVPDGSAILETHDCLANHTLWVRSLDGRSAKQIAVGANGIGRLSVSRDGTVAMETNSGHAPILAFKPGTNQPPAPLDAAGGLSSRCADFAPDGALAVTGNVGSDFGVWMADHEGAPFHKLMSLSGFGCAIRWSPDGSRFGFIHAGHNGGFEIPIVRRDGEIVTRIEYRGTETELFDWTADGKFILTSRLDKQGWRIWRTDLGTPDKAVPITPPGWFDPRVHGTMLFAQKYGAVGAWRLDQGTPQRIADGPTPETADLFTISGDRLYFADMTDHRHPAIASRSVYGGESKRVMAIPFGTVNFTFAVNPKSGDIVFSPPPSDDSDIGLMRLRKR